MRSLRALILRLVGVLRRGSTELRIAGELEGHLQMAVDDGIRSGLPPAEARRLALIELGGVEQTREMLRDRARLPWLETIWRDGVYALRTLRRTPALTATIVLTLALGIGATTAIFTVVNGVLLRPLPYRDPERLVQVLMKTTTGAVFYPLAYTRDYAAWRAHDTLLSQLAGYEGFRGNVAGSPAAERVEVGLATASLFSMLGVQPRLGRTFTAVEDRPGAPAVALLEYSFWKRRFAADPRIVGKTLSLNDRDYTIIGVLPSEFRIPDQYPGNIHYDVWIPFAIGDGGQAREMMLRAIGRVRPGIRVEAVSAELNSLMQGAERRGQRWKWVRAVPWQEQVVSGVRRSLLLFVGAVAFVLLIACVNVANLLLGRAAGRVREIAIRRSLGAGTGRIVRQLLTESVLLSLCGALVGLAAAKWTKSLVLLAIAPKMPALPPIGLDYRVLGFTLVVALSTGLAFGLAPALSASRVHLVTFLKEGGPGILETTAGRRLRSVLAIAEIALAVVLLCGSGLFLKSFLRARGIDMGMTSERLLTFNTGVSKVRYPAARDQAAYLERLLEAMGHLPGAQSVAGGAALPLTGRVMSMGDIPIEGRADNVPMTLAAVVSPDYFRTVGIPLLRGRDFTARDRQGAPSVVVVNQTFARSFLSDGGDVGRRMQTAFGATGWSTIVGIVADTRITPEGEPQPMVYMPYLQPRETTQRSSEDASFSVVIRTAGPPMNLAPAVRKAAAGVDATQAVYDIESFEDLRAHWSAPRRVNAILISAFAAIALLLGSIGIYGVLSYTVGERTHEIGIRVALGACRPEILRMVLRRGMAVIAGGLAIGLGASLAFSRVIADELWGVKPTDPWTFAFVALLLAAVGFAACAVPARRATRIDPAVALRSE